MSESWKPGDRVEVRLPAGPGNRGGPSLAWVTGTIREIDPPGLRPGVRIDLDYPVRGTGDCYATHSELRPATQNVGIGPQNAGIGPPPNMTPGTGLGLT